MKIIQRLPLNQLVEQLNRDGLCIVHAEPEGTSLKVIVKPSDDHGTTALELLYTSDASQINKKLSEEEIRIEACNMNAMPMFFILRYNIEVRKTNEAKANKEKIEALKEAGRARAEAERASKLAQLEALQAELGFFQEKEEKKKAKKGE